MDSNLESTIITVKSVEDMGSRLKLKGSDNKSYTLWKNKKDGNATVAYQNWQNFKVGDTVKVGFKSEQFQTQDGQTATSRTVMTLAAAPVAQQHVAQASPAKANGKPDWDAISVGKCQFGFLQAYIQSGKTIEEAKLQVVNAKKLAELVVLGHTTGEDKPAQPQPAKTEDEDMPPMPEDDEVDVSSIPF